MMVMTSPWTGSKIVSTKFKMADLWAILMLIPPCVRNKCGSFIQNLSTFGIHGGKDQPFDKFKNAHAKIQNGRLKDYFDVNFTL